MGQGRRQVKRAAAAARPFAWPVLVCSVVCVLTPRPAFADPGPAAVPPAAPASTGTPSPTATGSPSPAVTIPDSGVDPVASAPLPALAGTTNPPPAASDTVTGPLATQVLAKFADEEAVGQKLTQADIDLAAAQSTTQNLYEIWQEQIAEVNDLQRKADTEAAKAYKEAAGLGPLDSYASGLHQLGLLAPGFGDGSRGGPEASASAAKDAARAGQQASIDEQAYRSALAHEQQLAAQEATLKANHDQLTAELTDLRTRNNSAVAQAEAAQEQIDRGLAPSFAPSSMVDGKLANPKALAALAYAYAQWKAGKWYQWGAEGPDFYDCSGLVWAAYLSTGYQLPRVANDQFHATQEIPPNQLLPGDLLFFSTTSRTDWTTISHVAMYFGGGLMIEAPRTGEQIKITTVWWSAFFGATRIYPALTPPPAPPPPPTSTTQPPNTTPPPASPTPSPSTPAVPTEPPPDPSPDPSPSVPSSPPTQTPPTTTPPPTIPPPATTPSATTAPPATNPPATGSATTTAPAAGTSTPPPTTGSGTGP